MKYLRRIELDANGNTDVSVDYVVYHITEARYLSGIHPLTGKPIDPVCCARNVDEYITDKPKKEKE